MPYLLTSQASVQAYSADQSIQNLFKVNVPSVESDSTLTYTVRLSAGVALPLDLQGLTKLQVVSIKSILPFDVSFNSVSTVDTYTGSPVTTFLMVNPLGVAFTHLKILSVAASTVDLTVCGLF